MQYGDLLLIRDRKGRKYLVKLKPEGKFASHKGLVSHEELMQVG